MASYQKTYRNLNYKNETARRPFKILSFIGIIALDALFFILRLIREFFRVIIHLFIHTAPSFKFLGKFGLKKILIPLYRLIIIINRRQKEFVGSSGHKFFFFFTNRYVTHTVALLIIIITIIQNTSIRNLRAEDFGKQSILAQIAPNQDGLDTITEETIVISPAEKTGNGSTESTPSGTESPPALAQELSLEEPSILNTGPSLAQGGSAILKPDLSETIDTPRPRETAITYAVLANDTIYDIAEQFSVSVDTILWANKLSSRSIIRPGDSLKILPVSGVEHTVKRNETISKIAALYNIPTQDITEVNKLGEDATLQIGQEIIVPDGRPLYTPPPRAIAKARPTTGNRSVKSSGGGFLWPTVCRRITQYFLGWRHTGIDIACSFGAAIYAAEEGVVEKAGWNGGGYGNYVIIRHDNRTKTLYGHIKQQGILVSPGERVEKGETIGLMGSTGRSTGPHVHFELLINGTRVNPFNEL